MGSITSIPGGELRVFSDKDLDEMRRLAELKWNNARNVTHINHWRHDTFGGYIDGYKGEFAIYDSLGIPRRPDTSGRADPGYDVVLPNGVTAQIKCSGNIFAGLSFHYTRMIKPVCQWALLAVCGLERHEVWIVGGCSREYFLRRSRPISWGNGRNQILDQHQLYQWAAIKQELTDPTLPPRLFRVNP